MSDQPTDQPREIVVDTDQPHDHGDHKPADQATSHELSTLEEAAAALDITVNAVRQRLKRGTLAGVKANTGWLVDLGATDHRPSVSRSTNRPTNHATTTTDQQPTIDLAPLVSHITGLEEQVQRLTETTTMWQIRARQAEEQLKQLTAGESSLGEVDSETRTNSDQVSKGFWEKLKQFWQG
ncbi:MAG: hypothetical protein ACR2OE_11130 [Thermomicrobiales bacterium]